MPRRSSHAHRSCASIELTLVAALTAILGTWAGDSQVRSAAESLTDSIRLAQRTAAAAPAAAFAWLRR